MRIIQCDICGSEVDILALVEEYHVAGVVDACKACRDTLDTKLSGIRRRQRQERKDKMRATVQNMVASRKEPS